MFDSDTLHHASVVEGDIPSVLIKLKHLLKEKLGVVFLGNPDIHERVYKTLGIDDVREIKLLIDTKKISEKKIFLIGFHSMTLQAGNALLKSLEEPTEGTHFFLITPNTELLLDTLVSRVVMVREVDLPYKEVRGETSEKVPERIISGSRFLKLQKAQRLVEVKKILTDLEKEKISKKEIGDLIKEILREKNIPEGITVADYLFDTSSSPKIILEYFAYIS